MKRSLLLNSIALILPTHLLLASPGTRPLPVNDTKSQRALGGKLVGKIVEGPNNAGVAFATVALLMPKDSSLVNGAVADENGTFVIAEVAPGNYLLRVTNMGYQTLYRPNVKLAAEASLLDLGSITVQPEAQKLAEVVVKGEKTMIVDDIDKKNSQYWQGYACYK